MTEKFKETWWTRALKENYNLPECDAVNLLLDNKDLLAKIKTTNNMGEISIDEAASSEAISELRNKILSKKLSYISQIKEYAASLNRGPAYSNEIVD